MSIGAGLMLRAIADVALWVAVVVTWATVFYLMGGY